jgi:plastocyanin
MARVQRTVRNPIRGGRNRGFALIIVVLAGFLMVALSACGTGEASSSAYKPRGGGPTVVIEDIAFEPEALTVEAGDTVTWVWNDGAVDHDVSSDNFKSEAKSEGTFSHSFDEPGTYEYICTLHPNMTGTIEVKR